MFFWKKKKKETLKEQQEASDTSPRRQEDLTEEALRLKADLPALSGEERIRVLNRLGSICVQRQETDDAIRHYEESLSLSHSFGEATTALMRLYNEKRREAAVRKDDAAIQYYLGKLDALMAENKDIMRQSIG